MLAGIMLIHLQTAASWCQHHAQTQCRPTHSACTQCACSETSESARVLIKTTDVFTGKAEDSLCRDRLGARVRVDQALVVLLQHTPRIV